MPSINRGPFLHEQLEVSLKYRLKKKKTAGESRTLERGGEREEKRA